MRWVEASSCARRTRRRRGAFTCSTDCAVAAALRASCSIVAALESMTVAFFSAFAATSSTDAATSVTLAAVEAVDASSVFA